MSSETTVSLGLSQGSPPWCPRAPGGRQAPCRSQAG